MTNQEILTLFATVLTGLNVFITFFNFRYNKKKDFQDKLYQAKLEAYKELNESAFQAIKRLDINSTPYVQIYDFKEKEKWLEYCEENMGPEIHANFEMEQLTYKNSLVLPVDLVDQYHEFTQHCIGFVTMCYHFDTGLIIENQDSLWELYIDLKNSFRKDLKIDTIESGLHKRILSKM